MPLPFPRKALVETTPVGDAGEAVAHRQLLQLAIGQLQFAHYARQVDRAGDLQRDGVERGANLGREEIRMCAFEVEHTVQTFPMPDRYQIFRFHLTVAGYIIRIGPDIADELGHATARAAARDTDRHRPRHPAWKCEIDPARPDLLHEMAALVVEQDDADDRDRQAPRHAIDDAFQHRFQRIALHGLHRYLRKDLGEHRAPTRLVALAPRRKCLSRLYIVWSGIRHGCLPTGRFVESTTIAPAR